MTEDEIKTITYRNRFNKKRNDELWNVLENILPYIPHESHLCSNKKNNCPRCKAENIVEKYRKLRE